MTVDEAIEHFLRTGESDMCGEPWPGRSILERCQCSDADLRRALVTEVAKRSRRRRPASHVAGLDLRGFARGKVEPMVRGLFPAREQETVLATLERSLVFLTPTNVAEVLSGVGFLSTAWKLANLYLESLGADLLDDEAPRIVGLSEATTCYVSLAYFEDEDRFADYVVHEAAHVFHNCKRATLGLPSTRSREWLLPIAYRKRETFAYACETYSRLAVLARRPADRCALVEEHAAGPSITDDRVVRDEYLDILREAATARNGWKRILARCTEPLPKSAAQRAREAHAAFVEGVRKACAGAP